MSEVIVNDSPVGHHRLRPSSFPAKSRCGRYTPDGGSKFSVSGNVQHKIFASLFKGELPIFLEEVTEYEMEGLHWAHKVVMSEAREGETVEIERPLSFYNDKMQEVYAGTVDVVVGPNKIYDLKAGEEHAYWAQMAGYALALMDEVGSDYVDVTVLYSRYKRKRKYTITRQAAEYVICDIIVKSEDPDALEVPNEFCHWCGRITECQAIKDRTNIVAAHMDWDLDSFNVSKLGEDPYALSKALTLSRLLKKWGSAVEALAKGLETPPPGFYFKETSGRKSIKDAVACYKRSGLSDEAILRCCNVSMTKLVDEFREGLGVTKKEALEIVQEKMSDIITITKSYKTLEPEKSIK